MEPWQRAFHKKFFHYSRARCRLREADALRRAHIPSSLYKFRVFDERSLDALRTNRLWAAPANWMNDLFEASCWLDSGKLLVEDITPEQWLVKEMDLYDPLVCNGWPPKQAQCPTPKREVMARIFRLLFKPTVAERVISEWEKEYIKFAEQMNTYFRGSSVVLSMSAKLDSELMWSHYAGSNTGFCLEYDVRATSDSWGPQSNLFPVLYSAKSRDLTPYFRKSDYGDLNFNVKKLIGLIKFEKWAYEEEWRFILDGHGMQVAIPVPMPRPVRLIAGYNASPENRATLREHCVSNSIIYAETSVDFARRRRVFRDVENSQSS